MAALEVLSDLWDLLAQVFSSIPKWFDSITSFFTSIISTADMVNGLVGVLLILLAIKLVRG